MSSSHIIESNVLVTGNQHGNQKEVYQDDDTMKPDQCCQKENAGEVLSKEETAGVQEMLNALTQEEIDSFPDDHMPLRHFRAEKVCT